MPAEEVRQALSIRGEGYELIVGAIGLAGAVLGALIGAISTEYFNRKSRESESWAKTKLAIFSLIQKLNQIYSDCMQFRDRINASIRELDRLIENDLAEGPEFGPDGTKIRNIRYIWLLHEPYAGQFERVTFTVEEMWALLNIQGDDLMNRLNGIDRYNAQIEALERYGRDRDELGATAHQLMRVDALDGVQARMAASPEVAAAMAIPSARLDNLLRTVRDRCDALARETLEAMTHIIRAKKRPLGRDVMLQLVTPDGTAAEVRADGTD